MFLCARCFLLLLPVSLSLKHNTIYISVYYLKNISEVSGSHQPLQLITEKNLVPSPILIMSFVISIVRWKEEKTLQDKLTYTSAPNLLTAETEEVRRVLATLHPHPNLGFWEPLQLIPHPHLDHSQGLWPSL